MGLDHVLAVARDGAASVGQVYVDGLNVAIELFDRRGQATGTILPWRQLDGAAAPVDKLRTSRGYNAFGEVAWEQDARGSRTDLAYNNMGRLTRKESPEVAWTSETGATANARPTELFFYDLAGRMVGSQDANGNRTLRVLSEGSGYGGTEALAKREIHADGGVVHHQYDAFGDLRWSRDQVLRERFMSYDAMGRRTYERHASGLEEVYAYDARGQRIRHEDNVRSDLNLATLHDEGEVTDYDLQGRVVRHRAFGGDTTTTSYAWNAALATQGMGTFGGWTVTTTYANGRSSSEASDLFGRQATKTDLGGRSWTFGYDVAGRMTGRSGGDHATYSYLNTGLVSGVTQDASNHAAYRYDAAGNRISEVTVKGGVTVQDASAEYDALGRMTRWGDKGGGSAETETSAIAYDLNGNIRRQSGTHSEVTGTGSLTAGTPHDHWFRYDAMNRVVTDQGELVGGQIVRGSKGSDLLYDAAGQRKTVIRTAQLTGERPNPWWGYDPSEPETISYDYTGQVREDYGYDAAGQMVEVRLNQSDSSYDESTGEITVYDPEGPGWVKSSLAYDGAGRLIRQIDYVESAGGEVAYDRSVTFNAKGQVTTETVSGRQNRSDGLVDTYSSVTTNDYHLETYVGSGVWTGAYQGGVVTRSRTTHSRNGAAQPTSQTITSYDWYDGAVQKEVRHKPDVDGSTQYVSTYTYAGAGVLASVAINDGRPRTVTFTTDMNGQVIKRQEADADGSTGDPAEYWYRFNGRQLGYAGNNGSLETDYKSSVDNRMKPIGSGPFRFGSTNYAEARDFAQSLDPVTSYSQGSASGSYTARAGETLASIAANLWGDSALWYKLAEANGLAAQAALVEGQALTIPAGVMKNTHNASTFAPYDPSEVIGEVSPTNPKPQARNKCGAFGAVLLVAVAVAVAVVTSGAFLAVTTQGLSLGGGISAALGGTATLGAGAGAAIGTKVTATAFGLIAGGALGGAAGSVASQGVGLATGMQDRFRWKDVALAGLSGAVGAGVGQVLPMKTLAGSAFLANVARGAASSFITQGIAVATGLQAKFDWAGVAGAGLGAGVSAGVHHELFGNSAALPGSLVGSLQQGVGSMAGAIANGAMRSLIDGSSFGDNVLAALPDVIGSTIGGMIADGLRGRDSVTEPLAAVEEAELIPDEEAINELPLFDPDKPLFELKSASLQDGYGRQVDRRTADEIARRTGQNREEVYRILRGGGGDAVMGLLDLAVGGPLKAFEQISWSGTSDDPGPARILREFRLGQGPEHRIIDYGSSFSNEFAASPSTRNVMRRALEVWRAREGGMTAQAGTFTRARATFGVGRFLMATEGMNGAAHIIGSFNYNARIVAPNRIEWRATNEMSLKSYFYGAPISNLQRPQRYGSTYQTIVWRTDFHGRPVR